MKLTGAAILVSRGMKVFAGGPGSSAQRTAAEGFGRTAAGGDDFSVMNRRLGLPP
jgi:hypothetical protein